MNGGGEADAKKDDQGPVTRSGTNKFGRAISRVFVAQMCESIGFQGVNESALDSLAGIVIRYIGDLGKSAKFHANLAGRAECNVFDVIQGLVDLGSSQGFYGVSDVRNDCIISSDPIKELEEYVVSAEEIPFAQQVPQFPVVRGRKMIPSFSQMGETPGSKHIPVWLPAFPDPHTYIQTPVWNERDTDPRTDMIELARQRRKAERSLLSLQQRLVCNGSLLAGASSGDLAEQDHVGKSDVFENSVVKPLRDGGRNLLPVNVHDKLPGESRTEKQASLLETFAPAIEAMKDGLDSGSDADKLLPQKRKPIFLELKGGRKVFGESLDLRIQNKAAARTSSWFEREDEKDDKKRRVEFILRKSMENQLELPQL
ncbi:transcription initiation factor TFIID subunit 8 [Dorcoceras hygrometricum]|uniref:Transcription initiation factor TFIID subunit 8 n=1 Tax=Dorcoceras hygrometricum TaxID=472368 RepID=A0A2Z7AXD7_9LAMI|nr:transcription initiation factor TFIID subunit 8 [Dorcoceras hygrometricum]